MSEHCQQDGGFIGDAGCTHPNHEHSDLVKGLLAGTEPRGHLHDITPDEFDAAVTEGFYVDGANGQRMGFGKALLRHFNEDHDPNSSDIKNRKAKLMYAISTVKHPDKVEWHHEGLQGRTAYTKAFDKFGILAVSDRDGKSIEYVFNIMPKRSLRKRPV